MYTLFKARSLSTHSDWNLFSAFPSISPIIPPATSRWPQQPFINMDYMSTGTKPGRKNNDLHLSLPLFSCFEPSQAVTEIEITGNTDRHREKRQKYMRMDKDWLSLAFSQCIIVKEPGLISFLCLSWAINYCALKDEQRLTPLLWCGEQMEIYKRWRPAQAEVLRSMFFCFKTEYHKCIKHPDMAAQLPVAILSLAAWKAI